MTEACHSLIAEAEDGIAVFNVLHTTAALLVGENDSDLFDDLVRVAEDLLSDWRPFRHGRHSNPNAEAHILSEFAGSSLNIADCQWKAAAGNVAAASALGTRRAEAA